MAHKIKTAYGAYWNPKILKPPIIPKEHVIDNSISWGYFNGASQGIPTMFGLGSLLFLNNSHYFPLNLEWGKALTTKLRSFPYICC